MKNKSIFPFYIFIVLTITIFSVGYFGLEYVIDISYKKVVENRLDASKHEARQVANLLSQQLNNGETSERVIQNLQASIEYSDVSDGFICMFNNKGVEICHPNPDKIGQVIDDENSSVSSLSNQNLQQNFLNILTSGKATGGIRSFKNKNFEEIIYVAPVVGEDWIVASHANLITIQNQRDDITNRLQLIFIILGLIILIISYVLIRYFFLKNEQKLTDEKSAIEKLYFQSLDKLSSTTQTVHVETENIVKEPYARRMLVNKGVQLAPVFIKEVSVFYTENKITYIIDSKSEKYTTSQSLDEIFSELSPDEFFRANRQTIVSINSIHRIEKYGTTKLKVETTPKVEIDIFISKAKISEFKNWVGKKVDE